MNTYKQALEECRRVGTAHATGDALRAMYAGLIALAHGGEPLNYFHALQAKGGDDAAITELSRAMIRDRQTAWDALISQ